MKVRIKTWDEMEKEFGVSRGSIDCSCFFTREMENDIPKDRIVELHDSVYNNDIKKWDGSDRCFSISEDMILEYIAGETHVS